MERIDYPKLGETLYRDVLPNGLRLSVALKPGYTRAYAAFTTLYGGADRRFRFGGEWLDTPAGVAHFLEHKMFDMPDGDNALALLSANGAQPNAYTNSGVTSYHFESTEGFYDNLRLLLRFVSTPYFTDESVAKEQGIIGQEIRMCEDSPDYVIYEQLMRCLYARHPIRDAVAGTVESIAEITPETLYRCHRIFYTPGNMALSVAGDVDPERVRAVALETLPGEPGEVPARDYGEAETLSPAAPRASRTMAVSAPQLLLGLKLPGALRGTARLRQTLLSGVAMAYLYGSSSPFYSRNYAGGLLNADFFTDSDDAADTATLLAGGETRAPEQVFDAMLAEARAVRDGGMDADYFRRVMRAGYGRRVRALSAFGGLCAALTDAAFYGYNAYDAFDVCASVTAEEVRGFIAAQLCDADRWAMSVVAPPAAEGSPADGVPSGAEGASPADAAEKKEADG